MLKYKLLSQQKITWPKGAKVDGLPIRTLEDVEKKIDGWER